MTKDRAAGHAGALARGTQTLGAHGARVAGSRHGRAGAGRARMRWAVCKRAAERSRRAAGGAQARGRRGTGAGRARPGRWARGLGVRAGQGCALGVLRLVFNPVFRLCIFPESLNEHCSSRNFSKKKIF